MKKAIESSSDKIIIYLRTHVKDYWSKTSSSSKRIVVHQNDTQKGLVDVDIHDGMISNSLYLLSMVVNSLLSVQKTPAESYLSYNQRIVTKFKRIVDLDFIPPYDGKYDFYFFCLFINYNVYFSKKYFIDAMRLRLTYQSQISLYFIFLSCLIS